MDETTQIATRLLGHIRSSLLETDEAFGLDSDLFAAGMDSMSIMQIILFIEEEFARRGTSARADRDHSRPGGGSME